MICPLNAAGTKTSQCVGERCAWNVSVNYHGENIEACAVAWLGVSAMIDCTNNDVVSLLGFRKRKDGEADEG